MWPFVGRSIWEFFSVILMEKCLTYIFRILNNGMQTKLSCRNHSNIILWFAKKSISILLNIHVSAYTSTSSLMDVDHYDIHLFLLKTDHLVHRLFSLVGRQEILVVYINGSCALLDGSKLSGNAIEPLEACNNAAVQSPVPHVFLWSDIIQVDSYLYVTIGFLKKVKNPECRMLY